jgi:GNAT superfamily N-acetyltransferase
MESVRVAVPEDRTRFDELVGAHLTDVANQRGGATLLADVGTSPLVVLGTGRFERWLEERDRRVLTGLLDGFPAGFAVCHIRQLAAGELLGIIDACFVEPEGRGVGLGQLLIHAAMEWLEAKGCHGVDGLALPGDRLAKSFFEASGFKARLLTMHHRFD